MINKIPCTVIGTDLVDIRRIDSVLNRYSVRFLKRILTPKEEEDLFLLRDIEKKKAWYLAKTFCAKEAYFKAVGDFLDKSLTTWHSVGLFRRKTGRPYLQCSGQVPWNLDISLSDEYPYVQATVVGSRCVN